MRISWNWLLELLDPARIPSAAEVARRLTMAGLEVEGMTRMGEDIANVVVAEVKARRPHPGAEKLTLVSLCDGVGIYEVVCGAPNVPSPGGKVLWARPGARLPGGREIGTRDVRGVGSAGMICSETELSIGDESGGILVLRGAEAQARPGTAVQEALGLVDIVFEVNVTPNRGDCLGHVGIAREVAALTGSALVLPEASLEFVTSGQDVAELVTVDVRDRGCSRYTARVIDGLRVGPSPRWMRRRLEVVGVRPLSNLVDVTNYVMFELGQPLHAFDSARVLGDKIIVRQAMPDERMVTLDGIERVVGQEDLLICDAKGPIALAGVMGGAGSEVGEATRRVLLESACFDPVRVRRTARRLALHSESSHRFERGVDPSGVDFASARAARLLCDIAGGRVAPGIVDVYPRRVERAIVAMRPKRVEELLGFSCSEDEISRWLSAIGLGVTKVSREALEVSCPTFRPDLEREVDLIEEVVRLVGFDRVPATLPTTQTAPTTWGDRLAEKVRDELTAQGLSETVSFGFTASSKLAALRFAPDHPVMRPVTLRNPLRDEQSVMRTSLVPNLLSALARNLSFGVTDVCLFEVGHVFLRSAEELPREPRHVAGVLAGVRSRWLKTGGSGDPELDFYDAKGVVERLFASLQLSADFAACHGQGFLHPGAAAVVGLGSREIGLVGEVHPETREFFGIESRCFAFELDLEELPAWEPAQMREIPRFPAVVRDLSFFVDEALPARRVTEVLLAAKIPILSSYRIVEDYRESGRVPPGKKGMLWSIRYRAKDRTLTDADVDSVHEDLVKRLLDTLGAARR